MLSNRRLTISGMGGIRPYINALAEMNNDGHTYEWFDDLCTQVDEKKITKKEVYEKMGTTQATFDKYRLLRNIERVQHGK